MGGSDFEGLKLTTHVIDLAGKVDPFQVYGKEGSMIVGGLDSESWTGGAARFGILVAWMIFRY